MRHNVLLDAVTRNDGRSIQQAVGDDIGVYYPDKKEDVNIIRIILGRRNVRAVQCGVRAAIGRWQTATEQRGATDQAGGPGLLPAEGVHLLCR